MDHKDALNLILAYNCPNDCLVREDGVEGWILEGHCNRVHIQAKLVSSDPTHPAPAQRYLYEIVGLQITDT
jgi:hypothetical protein